jgi:hypothetical protein
MKNFDVAISFAGEDREIARALAEGLHGMGYEVFYDVFRAHDLWGKNLYEYLLSVYRDKAKYCIILLSSHYKSKAWTRLELKGAESRVLSENESEYILPVRLDDAEIPGLPDTIGYLDLRQHGIPFVLEQFDKKFKLTENTPPRKASATKSGTVSLTRIRDLDNPRWPHASIHGSYFISPVARLDIWVKYDGPGLLFLETLKIYHIDSPLLSGASGPFPPSHRYQVEYTPDGLTEFPLQPPLLINPSDQKEIHFEVELFPKKAVSGNSFCVCFLVYRDERGQKGSLPLMAPPSGDIVTARLLGAPVLMDLAQYFRDRRFIDMPIELSGPRNVILEPSGAIVSVIGRDAIEIGQTLHSLPLEPLPEHIDQLKKIILDPAEDPGMVGEAMKRLRDMGVTDFLSDLAKQEGWSNLGRMARDILRPPPSWLTDTAGKPQTK